MNDDEIKQRIANIVLIALTDETTVKELTEKIWTELKKLKGD
jgi:hypothetical protein